MPKKMEEPTSRVKPRRIEPIFKIEVIQGLLKIDINISLRTLLKILLAFAAAAGTYPALEQVLKALLHG
jgi:hypothetical protein